jgi:hypothetical protein
MAKHGTANPPAQPQQLRAPVPLKPERLAAFKELPLTEIIQVSLFTPALTNASAVKSVQDTAAPVTAKVGTAKLTKYAASYPAIYFRIRNGVHL